MVHHLVGIGAVPAHISPPVDMRGVCLHCRAERFVGHHQIAQPTPRNLQHGRVLQRTHGRRAWGVADERHLPHTLSGQHVTDMNVTPVFMTTHPQASVGDHINFVGRVSRAHQHFAWHQADGPRSLGERHDVVLGHVGKDADRP